jgi:hypothetical protein
LGAQFLDKIQEARSVEIQTLNLDEKQHDQEMSPASPIISLELPSTKLLEAFNDALSESKSSTDAHKQFNENERCNGPNTRSRAAQNKPSSRIVTGSSKNSPLFAPKQRQEQQTNKRTRVNSPSLKAQPESKKQRNRVTSSQYFSFSDIKFKLTPKERRIDALKSKEAQKEQEQTHTEASKSDSRNSTSIVDQTNAKSKEAVAVDAVSRKTQIVVTNNFPTASAQQHTNEQFKLKELTVRLERLDENVFQKYMKSYKEYRERQKQSASMWVKYTYTHQVGDKVFVHHNQDDDNYWLPAIVQNKRSVNLNNKMVVLHRVQFVNSSVQKPRTSASKEVFSTSQLIPYNLLQASDTLLVYDQKTKLYKSAKLEEYESVQNEKLDESVLSYVVVLNSTKTKQT